ncbi:L,D-transpeptidase [Nocardia australiensis]|uniref:L,D-transpeptidase n=1 Tax=Nocardia australiensis TaxID=2887191 RepID=UPI001D141A35|nr:L,D-transpeptidase [Nocardia australiensis]
MNRRLRTWSARFAAMVAVGSAGLPLAAPASADILWPSGPDVPGLPALIPTVAPCSDQARACLRLGTREAWLMDHGKVVYGPAPMSHDTTGIETPTGVFKVFRKKRFHWSTMHNAPMDYAVFFNGDIAYHVGPAEHMSHGCIRLTPEGAARHFNHLNVGDIVEVVP